MLHNFRSNRDRSASKEGSFDIRADRRPGDHRRDYRHADAAQEAVVTHNGREKSVRVVNISERGVMIKTSLQPQVGDPIAVKFEGFARMRGVVRWVKQRCIGVDLG